MGTRYEQTWEKVKFEQGKGDDFDKDYGNLVPSASISYAIAPGMNLGVNYSMRITRPGITYLNLCTEYDGKGASAPDQPHTHLEIRQHQE